MGMHIGLVAVKTSLDNLRRAFELAWPELEITEEQRGFADAAALEAWQQARTNAVAGDDWSLSNPGSEVYLLCEQSGWAFLLDHTYTLASDSSGLESISKSCKEAFGFVVESAGGTAFFNCAREGQIVRSIASVDGDVEAAGVSLPEEAGIDSSQFFMDETEQLMSALGIPDITSCNTLPPSSR
jgi:hypothetical protein